MNVNDLADAHWQHLLVQSYFSADDLIFSFGYYKFRSKQFVTY
ncbi:hypothetical protein [Geomicrobium sp. JCM 19039]|nr:hypothetical protein [Geomicrobium sp. JCM 19039]